jgi:hypothetical protein
MVEPDKQQMTVWRMRIACWIPKATDTLRICNTYCCDTTTVTARKRLGVTVYVHCMSCYMMWRGDIASIVCVFWFGGCEY